MLFGIFENYSSTSEKRSKLKPIEVNKPTNVVFDEVVELLKKNQFTNIEANKEYNDIYAEKYGYELSVQIVVVGMKTQLDFSVFGEKKRGKTRKFLKRYLSIFSENL